MTTKKPEQVEKWSEFAGELLEDENERAVEEVGKQIEIVVV